HPSRGVGAGGADPHHLAPQLDGLEQPGKSQGEVQRLTEDEGLLGLNEEPAPGEVLGGIEAMLTVAKGDPEHERHACFGSLLFRRHEESLSLTSGWIVPYEARAPWPRPF